MKPFITPKPIKTEKLWKHINSPSVTLIECLTSSHKHKTIPTMNSGRNHIPSRKQTFVKWNQILVLHGKTSRLLSLLSLIFVRCRVQKKKGYSKHPTSDIKHIRTMDVASFREISRIQRLENETLKTIKASSRKDSQTKEIWSGFWSKAAKMEIKKKEKANRRYSV